MAVPATAKAHPTAQHTRRFERKIATATQAFTVLPREDFYD